MTRLPNMMQGLLPRLLLWFTLISTTTVLADDAPGAVSVYVFRNGAPLPDIELSLDSGEAFYTDEDGFASRDTAPGLHQLQIYLVDASGNLAFIKRPVTVQSDLDSQVIVRLDDRNEVESIAVSEPPAGPVEDSESDENTVADGERETSAETANASDAGAGSTVDGATGFGSLAGTVISADDGSPIVGARVYLKGSAEEAVSDGNGEFLLSLPANVASTVSVVHADFSAATIEALQVGVDDTLARTFQMTPSGVELEEFVVLAPNVEGQIESIVAEKRDASSVTEVLGAEQFSRQGDSDAANALKRATGLTLLDSKYVFVRGLGDRYSTAALNGLDLPSPDPTRRVVPLDLFPTGVIGSITVQKGWSADLPANFGGGNIDIRTREAPDDFFADVSVSTRIKPGTTFSDMRLSNTRGADNFGFDRVRGLSGYTIDRVDIDQGFSNFDETIGRDLLKNPHGVSDVTAIPGIKLNGSFGDSWVRNGFDLENRTSLAWFGAYGYSQDNDTRDQMSRSTDFGFENSDASQSTRSYEHGGLFGLTFEKGLNHDLAWTNFFVNLTDNSVSRKSQRSDGADEISYTASWFERQLFVSQLEGTSRFPKLGDLELSWSLQDGSATASEPLTASYTFRSADDDALWKLDSNKMNFQNNDLDDDLRQARVDLTYRFRVLNDAFSSISAGLALVDKDRDARSRRFALFFEGNPDFEADALDTAIETFDEDDISKINLSSRPTESYTAEHDIDALYLKANLFLTSELEVEAGLRSEDSTQTVRSAQVNDEPVSLVSDGVLPQANITYRLNEEMQLRFGFSETISRPDFREFASTRYQDPLTADIVFGNEFLTYSELTHYDFRYEWYMTDTDNVTFGVFAKDIQDPIETVIFFTDVNPQFTYLNAESASLYGVEVSWHRELGSFSNRLRNWALTGNYSWTESEITVPDSLNGRISDSLQTVVGDLTSTERPMQGQSPHVLNLLLTYQSRTMTNSLVYNIIGERIVGLGTEGGADLYEQPLSQLDFVSSRRLQNGARIGFSLKNILDDEVTWKRGNETVRTYRKGRSVSLSLKYDFR